MYSVWGLQRPTRKVGKEEGGQGERKIVTLSTNQKVARRTAFVYKPTQKVNGLPAPIKKHLLGIPFTAPPTHGRVCFPPKLAAVIFCTNTRRAPVWPPVNCGNIRCLEQWRNRVICPWFRQSSCRQTTMVQGDHTTRNLQEWFCVTRPRVKLRSHTQRKMARVEVYHVVSTPETQIRVSLHKALVNALKIVPDSVFR